MCAYISSLLCICRLARACAVSATGSSLSAAGSGSPLTLETVVLDVGGMKCGGCSAAVKRMLLTRPDVDSAAVNLLTETAAVRVK